MVWRSPDTALRVRQLPCRRGAMGTKGSQSCRRSWVVLWLAYGSPERGLSMASSQWCFADFRLDPDKARLWRGTQPAVVYTTAADNSRSTKTRVVSLSCCDGLLSILATGVRWYVVGPGTLRTPDTRVTPP